MSSAGRKAIRIFVGMMFGLNVGALFGIGLILLLFAVCSATGGGWQSDTKPTWLGGVIVVAQFAIAVVFPGAGLFVGGVWAIRRNRRDETKPS